jgi:hypothetical protein
LALDGRSDFVAAAPRRPATILPLTQLRYPARWLPDGNDPRILYPWASGTAEGELTLGAPGRYEIWIGGSFRGELDVAIDGVRALRARDQLNYDGQFTSLGHVELAAGVHRITLRYRGPDLHPGSGGTSWPLGPLALTQAGADSRVSYLPERDAGALCGKSLDWIETLPQ